MMFTLLPLLLASKTPYKTYHGFIVVQHEIAKIINFKVFLLLYKHSNRAGIGVPSIFRWLPLVTF